MRKRFLIVFFLWLAVFEGLLFLEPFDRIVVKPFTRGIAFVSAKILRVNVNGTLISGPCFSVNIENGCNGVEATMFLVAAMLAFPAGTRLRALGVVAGAVLIQVLNLIRVLTLYLAGCYKPEWFETMHLAVWQTIIFAAVTMFFIAWSRKSPACASARS